MTGLEKMKSQILDEAKSSANDIIDRAQKSAEADPKPEMRDKAEARNAGRISQKADADVEEYTRNVPLSSCDLQKEDRTAGGKAGSDLSDVLERAYDALLTGRRRDIFPNNAPQNAGQDMRSGAGRGNLFLTLKI